MRSELHVAGPTTATESATNVACTHGTNMKDETVQELTYIWQELLGVPSIAPNQNYFDLGGDSPIAVQLFARIEKRFNVKLPLATLFEAPTIEELAQVLYQEAPTNGWSPLVPIQTSGSRPPFFCIHGAGGTVLIYRELSRELGADQPFYGLQSLGLDGSRPPLVRIEDMAALYTREIRKVQPRGPYFLGGYCMGGTIAYEVAQHLHAQGEPVALLALFDTLNWTKIGPAAAWVKVFYELQRIVFHTANFLRLDWAGMVKFFKEKLRILRNRIPVWRGKLRVKFGKSQHNATTASLVLGQIWQANDRAALEYVPQPYAGVVTDFRPLKQYRWYDKPGVKWDQLALGGERVVVLPVYPAGMLVEPFVRVLARALKEAMDREIGRGMMR